MRISVILPTRNPDPDRLAKTLAGLGAQTIPASDREILLIDNGGTPPLTRSVAPALAGLRVARENETGLTPARLRGIAEARGDVLVCVHADPVLAPASLAAAANRCAAQPGLGAAGGPVRAEFATPPPEWTREFHGLLALHEHGAGELIATGSATAPWPAFAPVGAGLCVRRTAATSYVAALAADPSRRRLDRSGGSLASGGDNDLVFTLLHAGWDVGYFPELSLRHLIPSSRLAADYLARLNEGIQRTWVRVLSLHGHCPWRPIPPWTLPPRLARAWWRERAWASPAHHIRWRGVRGRFLGQADLHRSLRRDA